MTALPELRVTQNFLNNLSLVDRLIRLAGIGRQDLVIDIGAGEGALTGQLALHCRRVIAIEKDAHLCGRLRERCASLPNVVVVPGDFLQYRLPRRPYKVFASIPFNLTSAIIHKLTNAEYPPEDAFLVLQKEAAMAWLGEPRQTMRAVLLKPWYEMEVVHHFRRSDFKPAPGVEVVLFHLRSREAPGIPRLHRQIFRDFIIYCFTSWNPTLKDALTDLIPSSRFSSFARETSAWLELPPSAVCFEGWLRLFIAFLSCSTPKGVKKITGSEERWNAQQARLNKVHRTRAAERIAKKSPR